MECKERKERKSKRKQTKTKPEKCSPIVGGKDNGDNERNVNDKVRNDKKRTKTDMIGVFCIIIDLLSFIYCYLLPTRPHTVICVGVLTGIERTDWKLTTRK